jgi:hypothetical protein
VHYHSLLSKALPDELFSPRRLTLKETLSKLNLDAWSILRIFALNPDHQELPVTWQFADLIEGGCAHRQDFLRPLPEAKRFLIVTEGSSDAKVLAHALCLLRPSIADFFYFVDMEQGYPFTGTGNVLNFCRGLCKINILNNVLVIYDNDAEGAARHKDILKLSLPANMRTM